MAKKVVMPKAGMAMETGIVAKWLKAEGDTIEKGEPLLLIETDKTSMEVESMYSGVLLKILADEGDEVPVVHTIAYIGEPGEELPQEERISASPAEIMEAEKPLEHAESTPVEFESPYGKGDTLPGKIAATPAARRLALERAVDLSSIKPSGSHGQIKAEDVLLYAKTKATPLAEAIAKDKGLSLDRITGSGFDGKITKKDVLLAEKSTNDGTTNDTFVPHSSIRRVIAKRMLQSHLEIPPVTQNSIVDVTELVKLRARINETLSPEKRVTLNDFVMMAAAQALRKHPHINATYSPEGLVLKGHINIGVAVALERGLIVPVVKDADLLTLTEISSDVKQLAAKAKEGSLDPDEYADGTFTISNVGMMGVTAFTPIINQPEIAILGVCAMEQRLEMDDDGTIIKKLKMPLCLTYDHRSVDGAQAALFSNSIGSLLENPLLLLV